MTEDGKFTVQEWQEMLRTGDIKSGVVELLPPLNSGVVIGGTYRTRDGGTTKIMGVAFNLGDSGDGTELWAVSGNWYEAATGKVMGQSQFKGLAELISVTA